jgi:hypothetical protein
MRVLLERVVLGTMTLFLHYSAFFWTMFLRNCLLPGKTRRPGDGGYLPAYNLGLSHSKQK